MLENLKFHSFAQFLSLIGDQIVLLPMLQVVNIMMIMFLTVVCLSKGGLLFLIFCWFEFVNSFDLESMELINNYFF